MSQELDYFPPNGTKWKWEVKTLNYSPWTCNLVRQKATKFLCLWPVSIIMFVDCKDGIFQWTIEIVDWMHCHHRHTENANDALQACLAAEICAEKAYNKLFPDWIQTALEHNWRPPI